MNGARGQALVLLSLTMLLLVLMVMLTLSIGSKVRSRMDLQTVADAAAYSDAVATARTLNAIAVMNRVQIAHTVSTIGTLSLISWATKYWQHAVTARNIFLTQMAIFAAGVAFHCLPPPARPPCPRCVFGLARTGLSAALLSMHANRVRNKLRRDTELFRRETVPRWQASQTIFAEQQAMHAELLSRLDGSAKSHAAKLTAEGRLRGSTPLTTVAGPNRRELARAVQPDTTLKGDHPYHAAQLVMGSRGHPFMPLRSSPSWPWTRSLTIPWSLPSGLTWVDGDAEGRGYLNKSWASAPLSAPAYGQPHGTFAHDEGDRTRTILVPVHKQCSIFGPIAIAIGIIGRGTPTSRVGPWQHPGIHDAQHSFETIPPFYDYVASSLGERGDVYGQPKLLTVMSKDLSRKTDPWDLSVGVEMSDFGRLETSDRPMLGTSSRQLAIGSGITYYSRPDHYAEPPNLFAPYWRAGLTRLTVDRPDPAAGRGSFDAELDGVLASSGQPEASVAFHALEQAGYVGFQ